MYFDILVIGGGAAGFFSAINIAEKNPNLKIAILEKNKEVLAKVRISGGGRCNVTHAEFLPQNLVKNYPRGSKELLSPFHRFMCGDVMQWFENKGVRLKIEEDGRVFPASNSSQTIIDCFLNEAKRLKISLFTSCNVTDFQQVTDLWEVKTASEIFSAKKIIIAAGSSTKIWDLLAKKGHRIITPVPSLFTFNTNDSFIEDLAGISVLASVSLFDKNHKSLKINNIAPMLITHWGFSGPAILKLSAWGARILAEKNYDFILKINWAKKSNEFLNQEAVFDFLQETKALQSKKMLQNTPLFELPKRLWLRILERNELKISALWADVSKTQLRKLADFLAGSSFEINGKSTFKEEFVTAGGVCLSEVNFKTYESKLLKNVYLAGEVLDIDAVTGGFNFQNAWTGGAIISEVLADSF